MWFEWDAARHCMALALAGDIEKAQLELENATIAQKANGMIPSVVIYDKLRSAIDRIARPVIYEKFHISKEYIIGNYQGYNWRSIHTQPPILPLGLFAIYKITDDKNYLRQILPILQTNFDYLERKRLNNNTGLYFIYNALESGHDDSPSYFNHYPSRQRWLAEKTYSYPSICLQLKRLKYLGEERFRRSSGSFVVEDPIFNSLSVVGLKTQAYLWSEIGEYEKAGENKNRARRIAKVIDKYLWNKKVGIWFPCAMQSDAITTVNLYPIVACFSKSHLQEVMEKHLLNKEEFWTQMPIPEVAINCKYYRKNPSLLTAKKNLLPTRGLIPTRGLTWLHVNFDIATTCYANGYDIIAEELDQKTIKLVEENGAFEGYYPDERWAKGGLGAANFGWSAGCAFLAKNRILGKPNKEFWQTLEQFYK